MNDDLDIREFFRDDNSLHRVLADPDTQQWPPFAWIVDRSMPPEIKKAMLAAVKAHQGGFRSIDYLLKRYGSSWDFTDRRDEKTRFAADLQQTALAAVAQAADLWQSCTVGNGLLGQFAAAAALCRLGPTFRCAAFLNALGHPYESAVLQRLILEQVAWAYEIHKRDDDALLDVPAQRTIRTLKRIIPLAGQWYGTLSKITHIDEEWHRNFVRFRGEHTFIALREYRYRSYLATLHLGLADAYAVVSELIYFHDDASWHSVRRMPTGNLEPKRDRALLQLFEDSITRLEELHEWPFGSEETWAGTRHEFDGA
jgi:hypothetical protein